LCTALEGDALLLLDRLNCGRDTPQFSHHACVILLFGMDCVCADLSHSSSFCWASTSRYSMSISTLGSPVRAGAGQKA
jgi:hypothetical protein